MDPSSLIVTTRARRSFDQPGSTAGSNHRRPRRKCAGPQGGTGQNLKERLRHLCALIVRDRQPFCPANGILALIPYTATDDKSLARRAGTACHLDVTTARSALGVSCPLFTLLCNMEEAKCFDRLIQRAYVSRSPITASWAGNSVSRWFQI